MKQYVVTFSYYSQGSSASDTFHFSNEEQAQAKFQELRDVIEHNYAGCENPEIIDEADFFGIRDRADGSFARVTLE